MGRLAAEVAHEVRGPLNAVVLNAQLLVREAPRATPQRLTELSASIRGAVTRVDSAVQGFLDLGRPAGPLALRPTDLADVVRQAAASEGGQLRTEAPSSPVVVTGDVRMLTTALANLVRNARQAAPPESVRVTWRSERGEAVLDVDDRGPGVPAARRGEIFEAFRTTRPDGTGLGLSLVRDAVERHGGRIEVLDAPGGGARFRMRLPMESAT